MHDHWQTGGYDRVRAHASEIVNERVDRVTEANLRRAAELTGVPDEVILEIYTALRPHRSTADELEAWANRLEGEFGAPMNAAFVREAKAVYAERNLLSANE